jgi:NADH dehydrogenase FAD-containing subunit
MGTCRVYNNNKKTVVIVGASFAGLAMMDHLLSEFNIVLIDKKNYFEYYCTNA